MKKEHFFSIVFVNVILLSGCVTNPTLLQSTASNSTSASTSNCINHSTPLPVDSTLQGQSNQFSGDLFDCKMTARLKIIGTDALIGAVGGASIGALVGKLSGFDPGLGAAIGAAGGGLLGASYGQLEVNRNESAEKLEITNQAIAALKNENQNLANYISQADSTVVANNKRFEDIKKELRKRKIKRIKAQQEVEKMNADKAVIQATLTRLIKRKEDAAKALPKNDPNLTAEMEKYQNQISDLKKIIEKTPEFNISSGG